MFVVFGDPSLYLWDLGALVLPDQESDAKGREKDQTGNDDSLSA